MFVGTDGIQGGICVWLILKGLAFQLLRHEKNIEIDNDNIIQRLPVCISLFII